MKRRWTTILISAFVIAQLLDSSYGAVKRDEEEKEAEALQELVEDSYVLLNEDGEAPEQQQETRQQGANEITDADIDRMAHSKSTPTESPPLPVAFEEFVPEKRPPGQLNERAETIYANALAVLEKRRWSGIDYRDIRAAYFDLEEAARLGHPDAMKLLAYSYLFGDYRWSIDEARKLFEKLAEQGSADAHLGLGFLYSTGAGLSKPDPAKGFLHYTFAALGGSPLAQMALGYRFGYGVSAVQNCEKSLSWYRIVAEKVASKVKLTGTASVQRIRIPDEIESSSTTGTLLDNNIFAYYKYLAETGDMQAILGLAQLYLTGGKGVPMDLEAAAKYFQIAAEAGNTQAHAFLGKMYLEGTPATPQNNLTALQYFKKAADKGSAIGQSGLGIMFLYGRGVQRDPYKALKLFTLAAEQGSPEGQLHLGQMYYQGVGVKRDFKQALKYFQLASQSGHILAVYDLAQMHAKGTGVVRNCRVAMELYKNVAERGRWAERFMDAFMRFQNGAVDEAAFRYLFLAELGYEAAQTNFAYLMDQEESHLFPRDEAYRRALLSWQRAANQDYAIARVKLGDYNYYGHGTPVDYDAAANHYKIAATSHQNAQAMFNLGLMHEQGLGVTKDLYLAKRFYDLAAETSTDAFVPVALALIKLRALFFLEYFSTNFTGQMSPLGVLDALLGPDWDLYVMSLLVGLVVWLAYTYYFRNRQQQPAQNGAAQQPAAAQ